MVVFDEQYPRAPERLDVGLKILEVFTVQHRFVANPEGHLKRKRAAFAQCTFKQYLAALHFNQLLGDCQAQSCAPVFPGGIARCLCKAFKYLGDLVFGDADSSIADSKSTITLSAVFEEFRNGIKIGEMRRDMQMLVINSTGTTPDFQTSTWPVNNQGTFEFDLPALIPLTVTASVDDADSSYLKLYAKGEAFDLSTNAAQYNSSSNSFGHAAGTITWTPSVSQQRVRPYMAYLQCNEHTSNGVNRNYQFFLIKVTNPIGIQEFEKITGQIYPTVVSHSLYVPLMLHRATDVTFEISDASGRICRPADIFHLVRARSLLCFRTSTFQMACTS
jgi:hypothetical protein